MARNNEECGEIQAPCGRRTCDCRRNYRHRWTERYRKDHFHQGTSRILWQVIPEPARGQLQTPIHFHELEGTVDQLLNAISKDRSTIFTEEVLKNLTINKLLDREIKSLSGGELQRVAIAACLGKSAQIYLLDEPSAFLDIEERLTMARALRHIIDSRQAFAFVVEHDIVA